MTTGSFRGGIESGVAVRLARIFSARHDRCAMITLDAALIYGTGPNADTLAAICHVAEGAGATGVLGFPATLARLELPTRLSRIALLSASTTANTPLAKVPVSSVGAALRAGADAVAVQFHLGAATESAMLERLAATADSAHEAGLPVLGIAYARSEDGIPASHPLQGEADHAYCAHTHAARVAVELGADVVKVQFSGDVDCLRRTVAACAPVPVLVAGGPPRSVESWQLDMEMALLNGARGVCVGRNITHNLDWHTAVASLGKSLDALAPAGVADPQGAS
jgi:DhnA family fructose-bisphosphate aldolase class Ia